MRHCKRTERALRTYLASLDVECRMNELRMLSSKTLRYLKKRKLSTFKRELPARKTVVYWPIEEIGEPPW